MGVGVRSATQFHFFAYVPRKSGHGVSKPRRDFTPRHALRCALMSDPRSYARSNDRFFFKILSAHAVSSF